MANGPVGDFETDAPTLQSELPPELPKSDLTIKVETAKSAGYSDEEIRSFLTGKNFDPAEINLLLPTQDEPTDFGPIAEPVASEISRLQTAEDNRSPQEQAIDLADLFRNVNEKYSTAAKSAGGLFSDQLNREAKIDVAKLNQAIVAKLNENNLDAFIDPNSGEVAINTEEGPKELDSSILNSIINSKFEGLGAIAGGIAGGAATAAAIGQIPPLTALPEELFSIPAGAIAGGVGAALGRGGDLLRNSLELKEDIEEKFFVDQMMDAGIMDLTVGVLGAGILKTGQKLMKPIAKAYDLVFKGNSEGAKELLLKNMQMTENKAIELVEQWEKFNSGEIAGRNINEKIISTVVSTQPGAQVFAKQAASVNQEVASSMVRDISKRAANLNTAIRTIKDENLGKLVTSDLKDYTQDVKSYYGAVRKRASDVINSTDYRFNLNDLAVVPMLDNLKKTVTNPAQQERLLFLANKIKTLTENRTFGGLLDFRQAINNFSFGLKSQGHGVKQSITRVINKVDSEIAKAANTHLPDSKLWLGQFNKAKKSYSKMLSVKNNVIFKALNRPGITEAQVSKIFGRYIEAIDDEFINVMTKLPPKTRTKVDGAVLENLFDKYSIGRPGELQAIQFPMLSNALKNIPFNSSEAKNITTVVEAMSNVFKNDVELGAITGRVSVPEFKSYLILNPVARAKFEVAASAFDAIKRKLPGTKGKALALISKVEKVLKDPLKVKSVKELLKDLPIVEQPKFESLMGQLQIELAKRPQKEIEPDEFFAFKTSKADNLRFSTGQLGKGIYLTEKVANPDVTNRGFNILKHKVNRNTLATIEDISTIMGRPVDFAQIRQDPTIVEKLREKGITGISTNGRIMLFNKPSTAEVSGTIQNKPFKPPARKELAESKRLEVDFQLMNRVEKGQAELQQLIDEMSNRE